MEASKKSTGALRGWSFIGKLSFLLSCYLLWPLLLYPFLSSRVLLFLSPFLVISSFQIGSLIGSFWILPMDAQRALLDELMGAARNLTEEEKKGYREVRWDDDDVCRFYMVRFCPHDLFVNTRSDLGPCPRFHDQKLKERPIVVIQSQWKSINTVVLMLLSVTLFFLLSFEKSPRHDAYVPKFEAELAQFCEKLVMDLDRRVKRGRERIAQEVDAPPAPISTEKSEQLLVLEEKIKKLLEQVETLGEAGKVDEAEALMRKVEMLNAEKAALTQQGSNDKGLMLTQEKKMALCEVCGSFLVANDAVERTQSHVAGKQHIGYGMAAKEKRREEERLAKEKEVEEKRKQREKERESRTNGRDLEERERHSERDRDRDRDRYRERESEHGRSRDRSGRGSRDVGRGVDRKHDYYRNARDKDRYRDRNGNMDMPRDKDRDRGRERSRSRSPGRHSNRRSSRSPVRP
ncbi:hypothetical protein ACLOJK_033346 [Asimina triloba]